MGKIFNALEKSKKKDSISVVTNETLNPFLNDQAEIQEAFFDKTASLKKNKNETDLSYKAHANVEDGRRKRHAIPFDGAEVLYDSNKIDKNLIALLKPQSFEAEHFKMLRANLLFPVSGKSPRSIIVTSAVPDEGKSFVAANLAISIAQSLEEHVLLIDCDMRIPCIHKRFGFGDVPGLNEYFSNGTPISSLLIKTNVDKLSILPAGKPPPNPAELLSSQQMAMLLQELKDRYSDRFIVIDSPPPKLAAETRALSKHVDGILVVVKYGSTPREMVADLVGMMGKEEILGIILNKYDMKLSSYYGYGKYSKYSKYYAS